MSKRIQSVIELAKYRIGDTVFWVILRPLEPMPKLCSDDKWMESHHPKVLFTKGPAKKIWPFHAQLPRLHHADFEEIVKLLRSQLVVEPFNIQDVIRSRDTGEFFYCNSDDEWMPESFLFDTDIAASKERKRIKRMIHKWSE